MTNQAYILFLQVSCQQAESVLETKNLIGLGLTVLIIAILAFFNLSLNIMAAECAVEDKQSDMFLVNADHFAVGIEI